MDTLFQDLRYAGRQLRKSPGFTATAVVTLALGIGANTAIFTLVHAILLRSLPVANPAQLYRVGDTSECCVEGGFISDNGDFDLFSYDLYLHLKNSAPEFELLAAMQAGQRTFSVRRGNALGKTLFGEFVSGNYFSTLGVGPYSGRTIAASDDSPASAPAIVVSYRAWQTEFSADPSLVGSTITVQTKPFTVVGIAPPGFFGDRISDASPDFWMPLATEPYVNDPSSNLHHPDLNWLYALGRVRRGTSIAGLQAKLSVALRQWLATRPAYTNNGGATPNSQTARSHRARRRRHPEPATANQRRPHHAHDSLRCSSADCLCQHCKSVARACHGAPGRHGHAHRTGGRARPIDPSDSQ
jgi:hypothetical protein